MDPLATPKPRNLERYLIATGKTEFDYQAWAIEVGKRMHINTLNQIVCAKLGISPWCNCQPFGFSHVRHLCSRKTKIPLTD